MKKINQCNKIYMCIMFGLYATFILSMIVGAIVSSVNKNINLFDSSWFCWFVISIAGIGVIFNIVMIIYKKRKSISDHK